MKQDRLFAASGIAFVVLELAGTFIGMGAGKTHSLTISSSQADVTSALAKHVGAAVWAGAYMEFLSVGFFLAFAVWVTAKLGGGALGSIARLAAASNAAVTVVSLGVLGAIAYSAGRGLDPATGRALVDVNEAIFVGTWFLTVVFLVPVGLLARAQGRSLLAWSAFGISGYTLVATPVSLDNFGQFAVLLSLVWVLCVSVALGFRSGRSREKAPVAVGA